MASAQTEPGLTPDRSRNSSAASTTSVASSKSGFRSLFSKKEKKPKEKKDVEKIVLTSRHAAAVKTKMMMDPHYKDLMKPKTAEIIVAHRSSHSTAAEQEARHPHSGPPALHPKDEMPILTRIISGDERDDEDEHDQLEQARLAWDIAKVPGVAKIHEHDSGNSTPTSAEQSGDEDDVSSHLRSPPLSPGIERILAGVEPPRPAVFSRNSYGTRFHKDEMGRWKR